MRVLIADNQAVVRRGLIHILSEADEELVTGEAASAHEALELAREREWDVVVLDILMPSRGGLDVLKELRRIRPGTPVLVLTAHPEEQYALRVLKAGAAGFMTKECAPAHLAAAVKKVVGGGRYISPAVAELLATSLGGDPKPVRHESLSNREFQVLCMIASGMTVGRIAAELSLSAKTVSTYRARILEKMGMKTNAELTRYAILNNLA
jgi:DNA-binding NarL/FixJ family response regulator